MDDLAQGNRRSFYIRLRILSLQRRGDKHSIRFRLFTSFGNNLDVRPVEVGGAQAIRFSLQLHIFQILDYLRIKAPQGKILAWDQEWRKIAAFQAVKKVYEKAGASASIGAGEALRTQMLWMTASGGAVVGNLSGMPRALLDKVMVHPEKLSVHGLTLEQALRRKWVDAEERVVWMERFEHASQALVSELKEMVLSKVAADTKPDRPRTPEKDRIF